MANPKIKLECGNYYHIYNRGINSCNLFHETRNYEYFLRLYDSHIFPVAETFAWVLMRNHFHLLVRIRSLNPEGFISNEGFKNLQGLKLEKYINQQFSNFFNAYCKAFNKRYHRTGSLFEHPFKRKLIEDVSYLKRVLLYIHNNPVHHKFCNHTIEYPWSSYLTYFSMEPTQLKHEKVVGWFDDQANFKYWHDQNIEIDDIEKWLEI